MEMIKTKLDYGLITDEIIKECPDLKRHEAIVFEVVKKVSMYYGVALNGTQDNK